MKLIINYILILYFSFGLLFGDGTQPSGSGTAGNPYLISNMQHLIWVSTNPSSWSSNFLQTNNIDVIEIDDYDGGAGFRPIGDNTNGNFSGTYDGGGHVVDYLYINRPSTNFIGMFGSTQGATIQNLGITNPTIAGNEYVGTLVGMTHNTEITNCFTSGTVAASIRGNMNFVGGLIGHNNNSNILGCYSTLQVTGVQSVIGGLVGWNSTGSEIIDSYSTGFVINESSTGGHMGGLVGENNNSLIKCSYSSGDVTGAYTGIGGFVGVNRENAIIQNCFSRGDVYITNGSNITNGAFCGYMNNDNNSSIETSYTTGSVYYSIGGDPVDRGFVGWDEYNQGGYYSNNFWDKEVSNQENVFGATAMDNGEAQNAYTYLSAGWDFVGETANGTDDYWNIDYSSQGINKANSVLNTNAINDGYPFFSWQSNNIPEIRIIVDGVEFYNGQGYDFGFVVPGGEYNVEVTVENVGSADLYLFPLPEIVTPYTSYFSFVT